MDETNRITRPRGTSSRRRPATDDYLWPIADAAGVTGPHRGSSFARSLAMAGEPGARGATLNSQSQCGVDFLRLASGHLMPCTTIVATTERPVVAIQPTATRLSLSPYIATGDHDYAYPMPRKPRTASPPGLHVRQAERDQPSSRRVGNLERRQVEVAAIEPASLLRFAAFPTHQGRIHHDVLPLSKRIA